MAIFSSHKFVDALPGTLEANSVYFVKDGAGILQYVTNDQGTIVAYPIKANEKAKAFFRAYTDCVAATNDKDFTFTVSGTGAAFSSLAIGVENAVGILRGALGTVATNRFSIASANFSVLLFGKGKAFFEADCRFPVLSDATNTYTFRAGFIDSVTAESADGLFFRYTHSVNGGRFEAVSRNNNAQTVVDTQITVAANTWYDFEISVNAAGTSAQFKINDVVVATITTNIPTATGRETGYGIFCLRSVGTAAINALEIDFIEVKYEFTNSR